MTFREWLKKTWASWILDDVPASIYGCEICGKAECSNNKFENCDFRLKCENAIESGDSRDTSTSDLGSDYDQAPDTVVAVSGTRSKVSTRSDSFTELDVAEAKGGRR